MDTLKIPVWTRLRKAAVCLCVHPEDAGSAFPLANANAMLNSKDLGSNKPLSYQHEAIAEIFYRY